jgi:hypothetical protein
VSKVSVAVAVADEAQTRIYEIAAACRAAGFQHRTTLAMVGVMTGLVETDYLGELQAVPGVLTVEVRRSAGD